MKKEKTEGWTVFRQQARERIRAFGPAALRWLRDSFSMEPGRVAGLFRRGLALRNPAVVLLLLTAAVLPCSSTLPGGLGMGLAMTAVLVCTNLAAAILRPLTSPALRIPCYLIAAAAILTAAGLVLQACFPSLTGGAPLFLLPAAVNAAMLARRGAFSRRFTPGYAAVDGLAAGIGFTIALAALSALRELLGRGTLWGAALPGDLPPVLLAAAPCGGLLLLACLAALIRWVSARLERREKP
ncbi:Rnf-Nqr domain containing protein [uncultured Pseudoflavonifractor sp.]|uniref:Rnf-Nqr domain containing protein n=1 Tax=uncultured Pseudoflavonifractor sp. TaxID=1221379 RepID=UPI0025DA049D|nr:Rnf-Nqr domain containing protein [uncultured Pseudoflavonifractor sp.]